MINLKEVALHPATYAQSILDRAEAAELRAAQLEAERDELRAMLEGIRQETIMPDGSRLSDAVANVMAELNEARAALMRYQDERVKLLGRIEELAARVKEIEDSDAAFSRDLSEALNSGDGVYRP